MYDLDTVLKAVKQVVDNYSSLRGAVKTLGLFNPGFSRIPSHTTIHNWIMKLGVGNYLKCPCQRKYHAFIIDSTIEYGKEQLLLILGVRKSDVKAGKVCYSHQDVDVLRMKVFRKIDATAVENFLGKSTGKHGVPVQIISDHGSNIKKGISQFLDSYPEVVHTYDVTHKCAILLKHIIEKDPDWQTFYKECGECRRKILNTDLISYGPQKARDKSRHLNLDHYLEWTENILYVGRLKENRESEKFQECFGWVKKYRKKLKIWKEMLEVLNTANKEISTKGLSNETLSNLEKNIDSLGMLCPEAEYLYCELKVYVQHETQAIPDGELWPGCSDIIESVFGRFKYYARRAPMRDISRMVMTIPIVTTEITVDKIKRALEFKTMKHTLRWVKNNIGESVISKRRNAFRIRRINCS